MQTELGHDPRISLIERYASPAALLEHFKGFDFFVAMRFHSAVFAMLSQVPLVAIDYDSQSGKTTGLMEAMGLSEFVLNIADVTPERSGRWLKRASANVQRSLVESRRISPRCGIGSEPMDRRCASCSKPLDRPLWMGLQ